jgi:SAM-dependent methyltransferase
MKRTLEEHASRFDEVAGEYDDSQNDTEEYRACVSLVVEHAVGEARSASVPSSGQRPRGLSGETVADLGTGTGAIALSLAEDAGEVVGRDISEGMMERAREKAAEEGIENVEFGEGRFREPDIESADVVVSNFAMHHLSDEEKVEAIEAIAALGPRKFVLGDVMFFGEPDPDEPFYSPEVDDPSTVGHLADALTDAGFALTAVERVHEQVGVLVAERGESPGA